MLHLCYTVVVWLGDIIGRNQFTKFVHREYIHISIEPSEQYIWPRPLSLRFDFFEYLVPFVIDEPKHTLSFSKFSNVIKKTTHHLIDAPNSKIPASLNDYRVIIILSTYYQNQRLYS